MSAKKPTAAAKKSTAPAPARGVGRPIDPDALRRDKPVQFRAPGDKKERWEQAAGAAGESFSKWAREGLDAWIDVGTRAGELEVNPHSLLTEALENHGRVMAAVAELRGVKTLSKTEERLLRILAPAEWARRFGS